MKSLIFFFILFSLGIQARILLAGGEDGGNTIAGSNRGRTAGHKFAPLPPTPEAYRARTAGHKFAPLPLILEAYRARTADHKFAPLPPIPEAYRARTAGQKPHRIPAVPDALIHDHAGKESRRQVEHSTEANDQNRLHHEEPPPPKAYTPSNPSLPDHALKDSLPEELEKPANNQNPLHVVPPQPRADIPHRRK